MTRIRISTIRWMRYYYRVNGENEREGERDIHYVWNDNFFLFYFSICSESVKVVITRRSSSNSRCDKRTTTKMTIPWVTTVHMAAISLTIKSILRNERERNTVYIFSKNRLRKYFWFIGELMCVCRCVLLLLLIKSINSSDSAVLHR